MSPGEGLSHKCFVTDKQIPYPFAFSDCSQGKACLGAHGQQSGPFFYIHHQGGTRSQSALRVAHNLLLWAQTNLLSIRAAYLPGRLNHAADTLSRGRVSQGDRSLHSDVVQMIWRTYGTAAVDVFADSHTDSQLEGRVWHPQPDRLKL